MIFHGLSRVVVPSALIVGLLLRLARFQPAAGNSPAVFFCDGITVKLDKADNRNGIFRLPGKLKRLEFDRLEFGLAFGDLDH
jgi:hypothetical protein